MVLNFSLKHIILQIENKKLNQCEKKIHIKTMALYIASYQGQYQIILLYFSRFTLQLKHGIKNQILLANNTLKQLTLQNEV
ncbi:hypothetical protein pb186bvf_014741 [Paramecium bursaria]